MSTDLALSTGGGAGTPFLTTYPWTAGTGFGAKYADPAVLPAGSSTGSSGGHQVAFSPASATGQVDIAVACRVSPFIAAYPWTVGTGFGTKYADPITPPTQPTETINPGSMEGQSCQFLPTTGQDILLTNLGASTGPSGVKSNPYFWAWPWTIGTGFGARYAVPTNYPTETTQNDKGYAAFNPSGTDVVVSTVFQTGATHVFAYVWTPGTGFGTKYSEPSTQPDFPGSGGVSRPFFPVNGQDVGFVNTVSTGIGLSIYPWAHGVGFGARYTAPLTGIAGVASGSGGFSPDNRYVGCASSASPGINVYGWTSGIGFGAKVSNPTTLPPVSPGFPALSLQWSQAGSDLYVGLNQSPFTYAYPWADGFGAKYSDPGVLPFSATYFAQTTSGVPAVPPAPTGRPACTPQAATGNGGIGHFGCNNGGIGWTSSYSGSYGAVPSYADPSDGQAITGLREFDVWIELQHKDYPSGVITTYAKALTDLADPPTYHAGLKAAGLLSIGDIEHGLSNEQGGFVPASCDIRFTDAIDRFWRKLLATQDLEGDECDVFLASPSARAAGTAARPLGRFSVQREQTANQLETSLTAVDKVFADFGPFGPNKKFPFNVIGLAFYNSTVPSATQQMVFPVIYGEKSDEGAVDPITNKPNPKGVVPLIYAGQETITVSGVTGTWDVYILCGHAVYKIINLYGSDLTGGTGTPDRVLINLGLRAGSDVVVPGYANWPLGTNYKDYTGSDGNTYRCTVIYARGPLSTDHKNGIVNMTANVIGIEDKGDATGLPLIDAHTCQQHWIENWLINGYRSGLWVTAATGPKWNDGTAMVRSSSFSAAQSFQAKKVGGRGLTIGWYAGQAQDLSRWVAEWNRSTETRLGLNWHGQFMLGWIDDTVDTTTFPRVTDVTDFFGSVHRLTGEERENLVVGVCDWDPDAQIYRAGPFTYSNQAAITQNKGHAKQGDPSGNGTGLFTSSILNRDTQLQGVLQRRLARLKLGATTVTVTGLAGWLDYEVGTGVRVNGVEGPSASGWVDEPMLILRSKFSIKERKTTLTLLDLGVTGILTNTNQRFTATDTISAPIATDTATNAPLARV